MKPPDKLMSNIGFPIARLTAKFDPAGQADNLVLALVVGNLPAVRLSKRERKFVVNYKKSSMRQVLRVAVYSRLENTRPCGRKSNLPQRTS